MRKSSQPSWSLPTTAPLDRRPVLRNVQLAFAVLLIAGIGYGTARADEPTETLVIEMKAISGWYEGRAVQYVTTDTSDKDVAAATGSNFVPRLANAIPAQPLAPGSFSALDNIYSFTNFKQGGVLPSVPEPAGAGNADKSYSPLWLMNKVTWLPNNQPRVLKSEEEVLQAAEKRQVSITKTNIVINCPVIFSVAGGTLPSAKIIKRIESSASPTTGQK